MSLVLIDKSAYVRGSRVAGPDDEPCLCAVTRFEILYSATSAADYARLASELAQFRDLRVDTETFATTLTAQRELARLGSHRIPMPDVLIAACAQQHGADVLHVDRHYDKLTQVLNFRSRRAR